MIEEAPASILKSISLSLNQYGELVIDAVDGNDEDASRAALPAPAGPFLLAFNPLTRDWTAIPTQDIPDGYEIAKIIKKVE
jgi:hypothetical protein